MPDDSQDTEQPAPQPAPDPHAGMGGSYVMENGVRRLVERTQTPGDDAGNEGS